MGWLNIEQDVRYAVRTLRRSPGFAVVAVLTLALGIGASTAIYSVVDTILLQPLPFSDADRLVYIAENVPSSVPGRAPFPRGITYQQFLDWRTRSTTLADAFGASSGENVVKTAEGMARLWGATVTANTFSVLGSAAMLGRTRAVWGRSIAHAQRCPVLSSRQPWSGHGRHGTTAPSMAKARPLHSKRTQSPQHPRSRIIDG